MPDQFHSPIHTSSRLHAFYHPAPSGRLFTLYRKAANPGRYNDSLVILVPPFAEEMNASRRAYSALAQALSRQGNASLMFDFYGTGDSEGDFDDADWETWQNDLLALLQFARSELNCRDIQLFGLRSAALHIAELLVKTNIADITQLVFWQPILQGREQIDQFLRLRLASGMLLINQDKEQLSQIITRESTQSLRDLARRDGGVEVAGYGVTASLINAMDSKGLLPLLQRIPVCPPLQWLEVSSQSELRGTRAQAARQLLNHGIQLNRHCLAEKRFWSLIEAPLPETLIQRTVQCVQRCPQ